MHNRPSLVFADDSHAVTNVACALLSPSYNIVETAFDGETAIRSICDLRPDYAVLDIAMPLFDGFRIAQQVRQIEAKTLIVFLTVIDDDDYIRQAHGLGNGYVLKRFIYQDLLTALKQAGSGLFFCSRLALPKE